MLPILTFNLITILNEKKLNIKFVLFFYTFIILSFIWSLLGVYHGSSTAAIFDFIRLYIVFFIIYFLIFNGFEKFDYIKVYLDTIIASAFAIAVINILFFASIAIGFSIPESLSGQLGVGVAINAGYLQSGLNNVTSLIFISPLLLCLLVFDNEYKSERKVYLFLAVFCCILSSLASSRRTLIFLLIASPILLSFISVFFQENLNEFNVTYCSNLIISSCRIIKYA